MAANLRTFTKQLWKDGQMACRHFGERFPSSSYGKSLLTCAPCADNCPKSCLLAARTTCTQSVPRLQCLRNIQHKPTFRKVSGKNEETSPISDAGTRFWDRVCGFVSWQSVSAQFCRTSVGPHRAALVVDLLDHPGGLCS